MMPSSAASAFAFFARRRAFSVALRFSAKLVDIREETSAWPTGQLARQRPFGVDEATPRIGCEQIFSKGKGSNGWATRGLAPPFRSAPRYRWPEPSWVAGGYDNKVGVNAHSLEEENIYVLRTNLKCTMYRAHHQHHTYKCASVSLARAYYVAILTRYD